MRLYIEKMQNINNYFNKKNNLTRFDNENLNLIVYTHLLKMFVITDDFKKEYKEAFKEDIERRYFKTLKKDLLITTKMFFNTNIYNLVKKTNKKKIFNKENLKTLLKLHKKYNN